MAMYGMTEEDLERKREELYAEYTRYPYGRDDLVSAIQEIDFALGEIAAGRHRSRCIEARDRDLTAGTADD